MLLETPFGRLASYRKPDKQDCLPYCDLGSGCLLSCKMSSNPMLLLAWQPAVGSEGREKIGYSQPIRFRLRFFSRAMTEGELVAVPIFCSDDFCHGLLNGS